MDAVRPIIPAGFEQGAPAESAGRPTPVMEQYIEIKGAHPDCLLFYRMGDFYELFFEDAEVASRALGIVLTKRGKHLGRDIPMCGVPVHRADEYLQRLILAGHRVAVCEQTEDPAEARRRGAKSVVRRNVTRLVTPGTLTEDTLLDPRRNNYLLAIARARGSSADESRFALAWIDISTGEFRLAECDHVGVARPNGVDRHLTIVTVVGDVFPAKSRVQRFEVERRSRIRATRLSFDAMQIG